MKPVFGTIVIGGRPYAIAGGPPNVYMTCKRDVRYVYRICSAARRRQKPKMTAANNYVWHKSFVSFLPLCSVFSAETLRFYTLCLTGELQWSFFLNWIIIFWDTLILQMYLTIIQIINFQGNLSENLAKTATLLITHASFVLQRSSVRVARL